MRQINFQNFVWVDINPDQEEDMDKLREIVSLRDSTEEILEAPIHLQRIEKFQDYLSVVLHYPLHDKIARKNIAIEIDIILTPGYVITAHREDIHFLRDLFSSSKSHPSAFEHPIDLYLHLVDTMLNAFIIPLDRIAARIERIEDEVFKGKEFEMTSEISVVKRDVLDFRKIIRLHKPTISASFQALDYYFPEYTLERVQYNRLISTNVYVWEVLKNLKEAIEAFGDSTNSAVNRKLN
ncbi:MAG: CorA family divalent cation transporter [Candidatus Paceibacteria bacterium]